MFNVFPQSDVDIVGPDGVVRHRTKAIVDSKQITIPDTTLKILVGDEIRRQLPNGIEEAFEVLEPNYHEAFHAIPAHYEIKVRRKGSFPVGQGGNYTINVTGPNSRVNLHSHDHSTNVVNELAIFEKIAHAIEAASIEASEKAHLHSLNSDMQSVAADKGSFLNAYQRFVTGAANHMAIFTPFLPALTNLLS